MKKNHFKLFTIALAATLALGSLGGCYCFQKKAPKSKIITLETPQRAEGQSDVVGLRTEALPTVRIGIVGLGMRGPGAVERFIHIPGAEITALCDLYPERVTSTQEILKEANRPLAAEFSGEDGWKELCKRDDVDLVYVVTPWEPHAEMAIYAMEQGKHVAVEVPIAMTLEECWDIVDAAEKSRRHCMMLENCVYDYFELTTLNMAQKGLFGEILHVEGAYIHNLEDFWDHYQGNWRLDANEKYAGDIYATHGMGPACQLLDIHRGNRMTHLVAMDTRAATGPGLVEKHSGRKSEDFQNGDHTITLIQTSNGQTIQIQHNVMNPRPYSRMYQLTGTDGFANKYPIQGYTLRDASKLGADFKKEANIEDLNSHRFVPQEVKEQLMQEYKHPIHVELEEKAKEVGGHGGMDFIMDYRLIYCLQNGLPLDQDVYDAVEWSVLGALGRISIKNGNAPVEFPDFTRGAWDKIKGYKHYMKGE